MRTYLVCYDIEDDHDRLCVSRCLERYGDRVQYSVFEIHLRGQPQVDSLWNELKELAGETSNIRFYRLTINAIAGSFCLNGEPVAVKPGVIIL